MAITPLVIGGTDPLNYLATGGPFTITPTIQQGTQIVLKRGVFSNVNPAAADQFQVYCCRNGASPGTGNIIIPLRTVLALGTNVPPELINLVLGPGDALQAFNQASAFNFNFTLSGYLFG